MSINTTAKNIIFDYQPILSNTYTISKTYNLPIAATEVICPYCGEGKPLISQDDIWVNIFSDHLILFAYNKDGKISLLSANINYCPICGRKISKESA